MGVLKTALMLALTVAIATSALAADEAAKGKGKGKKGAERKAPAATAQLLKDIELTADQKEKVAAIDKEFAAKTAELQKKQRSILTEDQLNAQKEVMAKAKAAGTKGGDVRKEMEAAVKLTDEQKKQTAEVRKAQGEVRGQILAALKKVLTEDQIAKLPKARGAADAKGKKPAGEKKPGEAPKKKKPAAE